VTGHDVISRALVWQFLSMSAALLAVAVGVFAFVPLIIEIALQRSADADVALRRARRADAAFDWLLGAIGALGVSLLCGIYSSYFEVFAVYVVQVVLLVLGVALLLLGTLRLGLNLRAIRRG
jgi:hypothetical protein